MTTYHACVWLDHHEAKIFAISAASADETVLHDSHSPKHLHRHADHGKDKHCHALFDAVAADLAGYKAILIVGPGQARVEFGHHLTAHYPALAKQVWGNQVIDHPSDPQIVAAARKFFHAEDQMHG